MALFNHLFPYSNLHDINLDWIISIIKSIDPTVIQALQELTPDIIEQVTQKVAEAQAAAIAAQSSASEANTAKDNAVASAAEAEKDATKAAADAALANADAVRAENARIAVENSLAPATQNLTAETAYIESTAIATNNISGKNAIITVDCVLTGEKSSEYWTPLYTNLHTVFTTYFGWAILGGTRHAKVKVENSTVYIESSSITQKESLLLFNQAYITT